MNVLDRLPGIVAKAMGPIFRDATLHVPSGKTSDDQGGWINTNPVQHPCKALVDDYSDFRRLSTGIPANDRKIIILANSLPTGIVPAVGQTITAEDRDWDIVSLTRDAAGATYEVQGH